MEEAKLPFVPLFPFPSTSPVLQVMLKGDYTAGLRRPQRNENVQFEKLTVSCIACPLSWKESTGRSSSLHTGSPYGQALAYLSLPVSQFRVSAVFLLMLWTSTPWGCPRGVPELSLTVHFSVLKGVSLTCTHKSFLKIPLPRASFPGIPI